MKKICVFCGSSTGKDEKFAKIAREAGELLAKNSLGLVYGAGGIGIMGELADSVLKNGGKVWGIIPQDMMDLELAHEGLTDLKVVSGMHERKKAMYENADAFVALPGGLGTMDELCEIVTWAQLGYHSKPCWILNVDGFYDNLIEHFKNIQSAGFMDKKALELIRTETSFQEIINEFV